MSFKSWLKRVLPDPVFNLLYVDRWLSQFLGYYVNMFNHPFIKGYKFKSLNDFEIKEIKKEVSKLSNKPKISVLMPVHDPKLKFLRQAVESVKSQVYPVWELCIVDDASTDENIKDYLESLSHPQIKVKFLTKNKGISGASNEALTLASGDFVALLDHDDLLTKDALFEVAKAINQGAEFIYSDEDKINLFGGFCKPAFKPDYSPDFLLSQNYICHLSVIKKSIIDNIGGFHSRFDGSQDHDLVLRVVEQTNKIHHIPKVLYHWRFVKSSFSNSDAGSKAWVTGRRAVSDALKRRGLMGVVSRGPLCGTYDINYKVQGEPLVSIIIPFKDKPELLETCVNSILDKTVYSNFEVLCVNNQSSDSKTFELIDDLSSNPSIRFLSFDEVFNFSRLVNFAVSKARGEHIILCNNDIELLSHGWLSSLLGFSQRRDVGVVGAKLLYPNLTVQHAGLCLSSGRFFHLGRFSSADCDGYLNRLSVVSNVSAVTAALCMFKKSLFNKLGGFDESLSINYNDVDFCLRALNKDKVNILVPQVRAIHHESVTRGLNDSKKLLELDDQEFSILKKKHSKFFEKGDPYHNPNF